MVPGVAGVAGVVTRVSSPRVGQDQIAPASHLRRQQGIKKYEKKSRKVLQKITICLSLSKALPSVFLYYKREESK